MSPEDAMKQMVAKLTTRARLDSHDIAALMAVPFTHRHYEAPAYLVREGTTAPRTCSFILSGYAIRQKATAEGHRQIVAIQLPGDFTDLQMIFLRYADHSVQALTRMETIDLDREALQDMIATRPNVARAMWVDALIDASIFREWVLNVGQRTARQRIAHLLCEFEIRMRAVGLTAQDGYVLPLTQEQIGDAVGLTSVHVNRTLKALEAEGLIERRGRFVSSTDWDRMAAVGDFSALYLHHDQIKLAP